MLLVPSAYLLCWALDFDLNHHIIKESVLCQNSTTESYYDMIIGLSLPETWMTVSSSENHAKANSSILLELLLVIVMGREPSVTAKTWVVCQDQDLGKMSTSVIGSLLFFFKGKDLPHFKCSSFTHVLETKPAPAPFGSGERLVSFFPGEVPLPCQPLSLHGGINHHHDPLLTFSDTPGRSVSRC